jgi:mono/diheme cytochrome c family protein
MRDVAMMVRHFIAMFLATVATLTMASAAPADEAADQALVKQGEYVARTGDCIACHTAGGGKPFAGGLPLQTPVGTIYTTNTTPDNDTGIGTWSYDEFARLMRGGIHKKGYTVYPAMPYPSFSRMSDDDLKALYAYLMHGVAPVRQANRHRLAALDALAAGMVVLAFRAKTPAIPAAAGSRCAHCPRGVSGRSAGPLRRLPYAAQFYPAGEGALQQRRHGLSLRRRRYRWLDRALAAQRAWRWACPLERK